MTIVFYSSFDEDDEGFEYELTDEQEDKVYDMVKADVISEMESLGYHSELEQIRYLVNEHDLDIHGTELEDLDFHDVCYEVVSKLIDEGYYDDMIRDLVADEAMEYYRDAEAYRKDPYGYYGVSEKDFH